jgi:hypothetical protein
MERRPTILLRRGPAWVLESALADGVAGVVAESELAMAGERYIK